MKLKKTGGRMVSVKKPIISEDLFHRVQERVKAHKRAPAAGKAKEAYLLQGKCFCGVCSSTMAGTADRAPGPWRTSWPR